MVETPPGKIQDCVLVFEAPELLGEQTADKLKFQGNLQGRRATMFVGQGPAAVAPTYVPINRATTSVGQGPAPAAATFGPLI